MEPRNDESPKAAEPPKEEKPRKRRFQIIKLEERIAPAKGGKGTNHCGGSSTGPKGCDTGCC
jgi:hypothetical protein